jgi:predicted nucleotidyltransferase
MKKIPLQPAELEQVLFILKQHPMVLNATLFGSRAKGTHTDRSDIDIALSGPIDALNAAAIAAELEELPLPYRFDVQALNSITYEPLLEHIERVGIRIYSRLS